MAQRVSPWYEGRGLAISRVRRRLHEISFWKSRGNSAVTTALKGEHVMVDVIGGPDEPDLTTGVLAVQRRQELRAATGALCPEHPNCWGELVLRAATDFGNQELVFLEARKSEVQNSDAWSQYRRAVPPEEAKIRQLLSDGKLKKKPGPKGLFFLHHIDEKG